MDDYKKYKNIVEELCTQIIEDRENSNYQKNLYEYSQRAVHLKSLLSFFENRLREESIILNKERNRREAFTGLIGFI